MGDDKTTTWNPTPTVKKRSRRAPWWLWRVACRLRRRHFWLPLGDGGMGYCRCSRPLPVTQTEQVGGDIPGGGSR